LVKECRFTFIFFYFQTVKSEKDNSSSPKNEMSFSFGTNQIQGNANADFISIFPVIQWLVKKVIETREETGDLMRQFSESQFVKGGHKLPEGKSFDKRKEVSKLLN